MVEQRGGERAESEIRVEYRTVGSFLSDYATNISKGGMFVHTEHPLPVGTVVRLIFHLPGLPFMFDLSGLVRWSQVKCAQAGMGLEFLELDSRVQRRLEAYVEQLRSDPSACSSEPHPPPLVEVLRTVRRGEPTEPGGARRPGRKP
jgi:uncharacterized protein (TIGR02266 family)